MRAKIRIANDLLIDFDFFGQAQIVGHADHHDAVQYGLIGMVGFELLPLGLVGMSDDDGIDVNQAVAARGRHDLFLSRGNHAMKVFDFVFEDFDKFDDAAVADVQSAV